MAKIILKGIVKRVMPVVTYGENGGRRQSVILFVPGWRDDFGDQKGRDEEWQLDLFNDRIDKLALNTNLHEKRVEAVVYVSSQKFQKRHDGSDMWMISANLGELKLHDPNNQTANQTQTNNANNGW